MVNPIKKLIIVFICLALVACARSPKVIDADSLSISIAEEIAELEIDASFKNIDLVYLNTSTIISPAIVARLLNVATIYHIHEIPNTSFIYTKFIRFI